MFFNLYPKSKIIAIGGSAENACKSFGIVIDGKVRHMKQILKEIEPTVEVLKIIKPIYNFKAEE